MAAVLHGVRGANARTEFELTDSLRRRFWQKVIKTDGGCWEFGGAHRNGYGAIKHDKKVLSAHVVSYRIHKGDIPSDRIVCHTCDNRICVNPDHLYAGTRADNAHDAVTRAKFSAPRGEEVPSAKLTTQDVLNIRALQAVKQIGHRRIASILGLSAPAVKSVASGKNWKHIPALSMEEAIATVNQITVASA